MVYIFFIYGLSFFSFGLALLLYPKEMQGVRLVKHIWLLGVFGILHGLNEWVDMFKAAESAHVALFNILGFILLPLSYLSLLYFGLISIMQYTKKISYTAVIAIIVLLVSVFFVLTFQNSNHFLAGNVWSRYLFGIPGIFLTSYILFSQKDAEGIYLFPAARGDLLILSFTFAAYGILSGVIVPSAPIGMATVLNHTTFQEYVGVPVQLFRALCAAVAAYAAIALLRVLRHELQTQLIQLSKAVEVSGDSVVITDQNGIIQYVNPAFVQQTGFSKKEVRDQKISILKSGIHPIGFYQNMWRTILSGETFRGYLINKKKNGELYHEYKAISAIKDDKERIISFVSTGKDVTEHMVHEEKLEQLASTDKLTGLANRTKFDEMLHYSIDRAKRYNVDLSIILFDIDNFKKVNDVYGHLCGDDVLKAIAQIGKENIRKSDLIARWGGEEFMVLQPDIPEEEASVLAERLRKAVESHTFEYVGTVTVSLGVTHFLKSDDAGTFLKRADEALYAAKKSGKNRVVII